MSVFAFLTLIKLNKRISNCITFNYEEKEHTRGCDGAVRVGVWGVHPGNGQPAEGEQEQTAPKGTIGAYLVVYAQNEAKRPAQAKNKRFVLS
jgi:hypothetical protein